MARYDQQKCDGCGRQFRPGDDIVVCPVCGTPQHRECWDRNHACVNDARHKEGFLWKEEAAEGEQEQKKSVTCPQCGEKVVPGTLFCTRCGQPLGESNTQPNNPFGQNPYGTGPFGQSPFGGEGSPFGGQPPYGAGPFGAPFFNPYGGVSPQEKIDGVPVPDVAEAVQANSQFYIPKFKAMENGKKKIGWNWGAFVFGYMWYFYRKSYVAGLIYALVQIMISVIFMEPLAKYQELSLQMLGNSSGAAMEALSAMLPVMLLFGAVTLGVRVLFTLVSNYIYRGKVFKIISSAKESAQEEEAYHMAVRQKGGANFLYGALSYMGLSLLAQLMYMVVQMIIQ